MWIILPYLIFWRVGEFGFRHHWHLSRWRNADHATWIRASRGIQEGCVMCVPSLDLSQFLSYLTSKKMEALKSRISRIEVWNENQRHREGPARLILLRSESGKLWLNLMTEEKKVLPLKVATGWSRSVVLTCCAWLHGSIVHCHIPTYLRLLISSRAAHRTFFACCWTFPTKVLSGHCCQIMGLTHSLTNCFVVQLTSLFPMVLSNPEQGFEVQHTPLIRPKLHRSHQNIIPWWRKPVQLVLLH